MEDAGFVIRDQLAHIFASGFPKGKAQLKPAREDWWLARKPGPLRPLGIDETRIPAEPYSYPNGPKGNVDPTSIALPRIETPVESHPLGRWPSNVLLSTPELFDQPNPYVVGSGATVQGAVSNGRRAGNGAMFDPGEAEQIPSYGDIGGYSRFFLIPSRYNGTCVRCGRATTAGPTSYQLSPSADSAPSDAPTSPVGTPDSTAPDSMATIGDGTTTDEPESRSWIDDEGNTPNIPRSKRRGISHASTRPFYSAKSPDAASPEIVTTTTTPVRSMCATCADAITSLTTSDSDEQLEPYPRALIIPKADRAERERGLAGREVERIGESTWAGECKVCGSRMMLNGKTTCGHDDMRWVQGKARANVHPTVKPIDLMRHLVRLVTPNGGTVLDPFLGSGTTCLAASEEGFRSIGIERELEYLEIAKGRLMATPMGLGLDHGITGKALPKTHPDLSKHQPKRRAAGENYSGGWAGTDEEPAA
jgi:hypothetical protein